ncbi:hypothetical protein SAMD00019534_098680 [Acytostelium subglobosum LB1]|uniref:hypothetical protein n=1 Tax=Acytostelium subglobosum LB1 TaxID=1410327 RepID=UPI000644C121|nr:hypothetical protein SAMD00019534_098680 [Acytostelium subglobosum LB1]GAM26693.1 hypothetical protein SAMD00019534_098680 [Acytostelium subglobosum LB1]|eukprot:XP_012750354.1 hypothetical protein SAMD00019534_098680 [Acytostelium subglobosum LB1]
MSLTYESLPLIIPVGSVHYDDDYTAIKGKHEEKPPRVISFISFLAIMYFCVSGGPYGIEGAVAAGPPVYVLLTFLVLPFFWAYPLGMITAELANLTMEDGGASMWAERAFNPYISMFVGFVGWTSTIVDLSLYPLLFVQYLSNCFEGTPYAGNPWAGNLDNCLHCRWIFAVVVILAVMAINIWGAEEVGVVSNILAVILLLPFIILVCMGIGHVEWKTVMDGEGGLKSFKSLDIGLLITTMMWSFSGYDASGQLAGEVKNPSRNYPLGIICVLLISIVSYVLPLVVGMSYNQNWSQWVAGEFSDVALLVGGHWLNVFLSVGGMASSIGLLNANLCTCSRNIFSLSQRGHLPSFFSKIAPKRGTPWVAIVLNSTVVGLLTILPFNSILSLDMSLYSIVVLFECASYVKLFIWKPELPRPYKAVTTKFGLFLLTGFPVTMALLLLVTQPWDSQWKTMVVVGVYAAISVARYIIVRVRASKHHRDHLYMPSDDDDDNNDHHHHHAHHHHQHHGNMYPPLTNYEHIPTSTTVSVDYDNDHASQTPGNNNNITYLIN